eukprot:364556-Chlamydomonas_euryale.AAC.14
MISTWPARTDMPAIRQEIVTMLFGTSWLWMDPHTGFPADAAPAKMAIPPTADADMAVTAAANGVAGKKQWYFTRLLTWYLGFAIPGLGMFSEAYIVFGRFAWSWLNQFG